MPPVWMRSGRRAPISRNSSTDGVRRHSWTAQLLLSREERAGFLSWQLGRRAAPFRHSDRLAAGISGSSGLRLEHSLLRRRPSGTASPRHRPTLCTVALSCQIAERSQRVAGGWSAAKIPGDTDAMAIASRRDATVLGARDVPAPQRTGIPSGCMCWMCLTIRGSTLRFDPRLLSVTPSASSLVQRRKGKSGPA